MHTGKYVATITNNDDAAQDSAEYPELDPRASKHFCADGTGSLVADLCCRIELRKVQWATMAEETQDEVTAQDDDEYPEFDPTISRYQHQDRSLVADLCYRI